MQVIKQIVELKNQKSVSDYEAQLKPMTIEELKSKLHASMEGVAAGRVDRLEDVMKGFKY